MAGLTNPPGFGTNSWNEEKWSRAQAIIAPRFLVEGPNSWKPNVSATADRTIAIAPGRGYACGVYDETTATENIQFDPNTTNGNRYDYLVARYNWSTNTRTFNVIKGGFNPPPITNGPNTDASSANRIPGVQYDGLIGVATIRPNVGTFGASDFIDTRVWGAGGGLATLNIGAPESLNYLDVPVGSTVVNIATGRSWRKVDYVGGPWAFAGGPPRIAAFHTVNQAYSNGTSKILSWGPQVLGETDFVKYLGNGDFQFLRAGMYALNAMTESDAGVAGRSRVALNISGVNGGFASVVDDKGRQTGFGGAGFLNQTLTMIPVQMNVGSICNIEIYQYNPTSQLVSYNAWLNVTQVPG